MAVSDAHKRASKKWNESRDNIMIRPSKDEGQQIRQAAAEAGQSVQAYILEAVCQRSQLRRSMSITDSMPGRSFFNWLNLLIALCRSFPS